MIPDGPIPRPIELRLLAAAIGCLVLLAVFPACSPVQLPEPGPNSLPVPWYETRDAWHEAQRIDQSDTFDEAKIAARALAAMQVAHQSGETSARALRAAGAASLPVSMPEYRRDPVLNEAAYQFGQWRRSQ